MRKIWVALLILTSFILGSAEAAPESRVMASEGPPLERSVAALLEKPPWTVSCHSDICGTLNFPRIVSLKTPASATRVDVTLQITFDLQISQGAVNIGAMLQANGDLLPLTPPDGFPMAWQTPSPSSMTLTFERRGVQAEGLTYSFNLWIAPQGNPSEAKGQRIVVVAEASGS